MFKKASINKTWVGAHTPDMDCTESAITASDVLGERKAFELRHGLTDYNHKDDGPVFAGDA